MSMTLGALAVDLEAMLGSAARHFTAGPAHELPRLVRSAAAMLAERRPHRRAASLTLVALTSDYTAPADLRAIVRWTWGDAEAAATRPWEDAWPGRLPVPTLAEGLSGRVIRLGPAPTAGQIAQLGADWPYLYTADHLVSDAAGATTVPERDRDLLLQAAVICALKEMAASAVASPVQLHKGLGSVPASTTAAELWPRLAEDWQQRVAA